MFFGLEIIEGSRGDIVVVVVGELGGGASTKMSPVSSSSGP